MARIGLSEDELRTSLPVPRDLILYVVLTAKPRGYFVGFAADPEQRVQRHREGRASAVTARFGVRDHVVLETYSWAHEAEEAVERRVWGYLLGGHLAWGGRRSQPRDYRDEFWEGK